MSFIIKSGSNFTLESGSIQVFNSRANNPVVADIPTNQFLIWKNTATSTVHIYFNDSGTLKSGSLT